MNKFGNIHRKRFGKTRFKSLLSLGMTIGVLLFSTGCRSGNSATPNDAASVDAIPSVTVIDDGIVITRMEERGLEISIPKEALEAGCELSPPVINMKGQPMVDIFYYSPVMDDVFKKMADTPAEERTEKVSQEFNNMLYTHSKRLLNVTLLTEDEFKKAEKAGKSLDEMTGYDNTSEFGRQNGYIYLLSLPSVNLTGMDEEEKKLYEKCKSYMHFVKDKLKLVTLNLPTLPAFPNTVPEFSAVDLSGNTVTNEIFHEKKLTMVNVWGTFCAPCIEEMPDLGEMARSMPKDTQLIGLIIDIDDDKNLETAKTITSKADAKFTQIIANKDMEKFIANFPGVPATFFVDEHGTILGEPITGACIDEYKAALEEYLK